MTAVNDSALVWFRRDLRDFDHAALSEALSTHTRVFCAFVFDTEILDALPDRADRRVEFIWHALVELDAALPGGLIVRHGRAREVIPALAQTLGVSAVYANHDYEPDAIARDAAVAAALQASGCAFHTFKDQVIFERDEVLTQSGQPFSVFTPYKNAWLKKLAPHHLAAHPVRAFAARLTPKPAGERVPSLEDIGFAPTDLARLKLPCGMSGARSLLEDFLGRIERYKTSRDFPAIKGPSYLSPHLRFGTISIRTLASHAHANPSQGAQSWLSELIWRDFYHMILAQHPRVVQQSFRADYDAIIWDEAPDLFAAWCEGKTGYPLVDAAMRQLNSSGYMHNRLRMVVASFLTKDLGIDWRQGERYFAAKLLDYDLAANNGGWQWAASTGCDAQPYFRIFNPVTQSEKFDPEGKFIRRYLPELARVPDKYLHAPWLLPPIEQQDRNRVIGRDYPAPIVDHAEARARTLARFAAVREGQVSG
ncbi:MAG: hypothetical protein RIR70_1243 [Pseudomonadota bacterium]